MRLSFLSVAGVLSGLLAVAVGATLGVGASCLLVEDITESSYSIGPITSFPILPALIVALGVFSLASVLRRNRHLSLLTSSMCLGLLITSLTFSVPMGGEGFGVEKFGYPLGWLAWMHPPLGTSYIMGVIALPFLIDLGFWTLVVGAIIFGVRRLLSDFSGRGRMERR